MNRAERRRLGRVVEKVDNPTYYKITLESLDNMKHEITSETQTHCIKMLFSIPMKVVHEQLGWNQEECQWFAEAICDEYEECLQGGKMAIDEYTRMTEKLTGVRFKEENRI